MDMTANEIECAYRQSKRKSEQIGILADRNCCTKEDIINVMIETGKYIKRGKYLSPVEHAERSDSKKKKGECRKGNFCKGTDNY